MAAGPCGGTGAGPRGRTAAAVRDSLRARLSRAAVARAAVSIALAARDTVGDRITGLHARPIAQIVDPGAQMSVLPPAPVSVSDIDAGCPSGAADDLWPGRGGSGHRPAQTWLPRAGPPPTRRTGSPLRTGSPRAGPPPHAHDRRPGFRGRSGWSGRRRRGSGRPCRGRRPSAWGRPTSSTRCSSRAAGAAAARPGCSPRRRPTRRRCPSAGRSRPGSGSRWACSSERSGGSAWGSASGLAWPSPLAVRWASVWCLPPRAPACHQRDAGLD